MAYEHQGAVVAVADKIVQVVQLLIDEVDDRTQIGQLLVAATEIVSGTLAAIGGEAKPIYKLKFIFKVATAVSNRLLELLLPDSEG